MTADQRAHRRFSKLLRSDKTEWMTVPRQKTRIIHLNNYQWPIFFSLNLLPMPTRV